MSFIDQSSSLPLSSAGVHDAVPKETILVYTHHKLIQELAKPAVVRDLEVEIANMELVAQAAVEGVGRALAALGVVAQIAGVTEVALARQWCEIVEVIV